MTSKQKQSFSEMKKSGNFSYCVERVKGLIGDYIIRIFDIILHHNYCMIMSLDPRPVVSKSGKECQSIQLFPLTSS